MSQREENALEERAEKCDLKERSRMRKQLEKVEQENQICEERIQVGWFVEDSSHEQISTPHTAVELVQFTAAWLLPEIK